MTRTQLLCCLYSATFKGFSLYSGVFDFYLNKPVQASDYGRQFYLNLKFFLIKSNYFIWMVLLILPKGTEFLPLTQIFSSLYLCNLMVVNFHTFKLKQFDLIEFIDWKIQRTTSGCKYIGIKVSECDKNSTPLLFIQCHLQRVKTLFSCLWFLSQ